MLKHKTFSPKKLRDVILHEYNIEMTPENITMFFKRHPELVLSLKRQVTEEDERHDNIRFDVDYWITPDLRSQIPIIQEWIDAQISRKCAKSSIRARVRTLRKICMGIVGRDKNPTKVMEWQLHPLAITEERALKFIAELNRMNIIDTAYRLTIRNFLKYGKGEQPRKISGDKGESGKYAHIYASKEKANKILKWITAQNYKIGTFCKFLKKTATRAEASKNVLPSHINREEKTVIVWDKGKKRKKQRWVKYLDDEMLYALEPLLEDGAPFKDIDLREARRLCWEAYKKFIPELVEEIPMPLHFWRHEFAQLMLRATGWNYVITAKLGGWHPLTLRENYGEPPESVIRKAGLQSIPMI